VCKLKEREKGTLKSPKLRRCAEGPLKTPKLKRVSPTSAHANRLPINLRAKVHFMELRNLGRDSS